VPLDLVGMGTEEMGGLGEVQPMELAELEARYRFFFNPIRYTSLGLAVCEAMMIGMPVVGLATTEMVTVIENDVSGYLDTDLGRLVESMTELLRYPAEARRLGAGARRTALDRFGIKRFARDWEQAFALVPGHGPVLRMWNGDGRLDGTVPADAGAGRPARGVESGAGPVAPRAVVPALGGGVSGAGASH
jgi:hypothetical protein